MSRILFAMPIVAGVLWLCLVAVQVAMMILTAKGKLQPDDIFSRVSHGMRTPLSVIKSYVGVRREGTTTDEEELRQAAERSVGKLLEIADVMSSRSSSRAE